MEYDAGDRITSLTTPDGVANYDYDQTDQLVDAQYDYQDNENYSYDDNGNRTNDGYVTGENNRLQSDGTYNYEYDAEGNRVRRETIATGEVTEYEWDYRNRLTSVVTYDADGNVIANSEYTYDVYDRRIAKSVDSDGAGAGEAEVERFVYDGDHIALTFDGEGNQTERFLHGTEIDQVISQENADGEVLWALSDHQGSVRMVLDNEGNVVNNITYDAFGNITVESNPDVNLRFSYTGREFDRETGLYNYRARYYDPSVGRFISEDPIGFNAGDSNIYRYVGNNPLFFVDPYGYCGVGSSGNNSKSDGDDYDFWRNVSEFVFGEPAQASPFDSISSETGGTFKPWDIWKAPFILPGLIIWGTIWGYNEAKKLIEDNDEQEPTDFYEIDISETIVRGDEGEFNPNIFDTFEPEIDPFDNIETFPRNNNDFLDGDTFTFPDGNEFDLTKPIPDFDDDLRGLLTDRFETEVTDPSGNPVYGPGYTGGDAGSASDARWLGGRDFSEVDQELRARPDLEAGFPKTSGSGDYTTYKFKDKSQITIRTSDGRVTRDPAPRYNPDGSRINRGWRYKVGEGEIQTRYPNGGQIPGAHDSNEFVKF